MLADIGCQALPGDSSYARADKLHGDHQWQRENDGPAELIAELRTRLRIGGDSTGIVIGGTGDESGPEPAKPAAAGAGYRYSCGGHVVLLLPRIQAKAGGNPACGFVSRASLTGLDPSLDGFEKALHPKRH